MVEGSRYADLLKESFPARGIAVGSREDFRNIVLLVRLVLTIFDEVRVPLATSAERLFRDRFPSCSEIRHQLHISRRNALTRIAPPSLVCRNRPAFIVTARSPDFVVCPRHAGRGEPGAYPGSYRNRACGPSTRRSPGPAT